MKIDEIKQIKNEILCFKEKVHLNSYYVEHTLEKDNLGSIEQNIICTTQKLDFLKSERITLLEKEIELQKTISSPTQCERLSRGFSFNPKKQV